MKKRLAAVLPMILILMITGCGNSNSVGSPVEIEGQVPENAEQTDTEGKAVPENPDEEAGTEDEAAKELTMDSLLALYENGGLALKVEEEGLEGFLAYENMKPVPDMEESLTGLYSCDLVYPYTSEKGTVSDRNYELQLSYWRPETAEEYGHAENEIDSIRLMEKESHDAVLLYEVDERFTVTNDLAGFLQRDYSMEQYLTCDLPNDFTLGAFENDSEFDDWLLEGGTEEPVRGEWAPETWYCPGGIGRGGNASGILKFENGMLTEVSLMMNHAERLGEPEMLEGCEVQALLAEYAFDLFTAPEWEEYLSQHPETKDDAAQSHYWYVFLGKEDSDIYYVLFLNQEYFTKDDAVRMAQSVRFTEKAFYCTSEYFQDPESSSQDIELVDMGIHNNEHNIYMGKCEDDEIRMVITRTEDDLSAAYITRDGAENFFQGELQEDSAKFTLSNDFGDYLNMEINTDDNGMISVNGDGQISGNNVVLTLNQDTFFPIGEDITNYYSSLGYEAEEAERFAAMIKDSVEDKAAFAKLISYPISIYDGNNNTVIENETAMVEAYDELLGQDFKEQVGSMFTKYMFANYQGICVEDGIMWFHKESSGDYRITAISLLLL